MKLEPNITHVVDFSGFKNTLDDPIGMYSLYLIKRTPDPRDPTKQYIEVFSSCSVMVIVDYLLANGYNIQNVEFSEISSFVHENEMILEIADMMKNDTKNRPKETAGED